jgi:RNA polymerase sigma-70 factor
MAHRPASVITRPATEPEVGTQRSFRAIFPFSLHGFAGILSDDARAARGRSMAVLAFDQFREAHRALIGRLGRSAQLGRWGVSEERFARALHRSADHRFGDLSPYPPAVAAFLESLHVEDLALACACADGHEAAWEHFILTYRQDLRRAGCAITGDSSGTELADSLYAELYGLGEQAGERRSLFAYFHGRSKLSTWLRAILSQRHVDGVRARRRVESLDDDEAAGRLADPAVEPPRDPHRARHRALLSNALLAATSSLDPGQRYRLAAYYLQGLTLAEIGRVTGEHEATVSRKLDRARRDLRAGVERVLRQQFRLPDAQVEACLESALEEGALDLSTWLREERTAPGG